MDTFQSPENDTFQSPENNTFQSPKNNTFWEFYRSVGTSLVGAQIRQPPGRSQRLPDRVGNYDKGILPYTSFSRFLCVLFNNVVFEMVACVKRSFEV